MRRILASVLLSAFLLLTACGEQNPGSASSSDPGIPQLTFPLIISGETPNSLGGMEKALNQYLREKIGVRIHFDPVEIDNLENYYLLQKSGTAISDFVCLMPAGSMLSAMVETGLVRPLDDLLEQYGAGVRDAATEVLGSGQLGGVQYMIPEVKDVYTMGISIEFNAALVRKYDLDISSVKTIRDLDPLLAVISENEPDVVPLFPASTGEGFTGFLGGYDSLGDTLGVLDLTHNNSATVVDWYETETFSELIHLMRDWYLRGYIDQDALVDQDSITKRVQEGKGFCSISTIMPTGDQGTDLDNPSGLVEVQLQDLPQLMNSYYAGLEGICISSSCPIPEKAMEFLNLLYTDPTVVNFLEYGVEGEDYTVTEDGMADNGGTYFLLFGQPANQTLRYVNRQAGKDYLQKCREFSSRNTVSPALGFVFDSSPVAREVALCRAVVEEYYPVLDCGCVDPDTELPKFLAALKTAGIDTVVAEKQRQLNEWATQQT